MLLAFLNGVEAPIDLFSTIEGLFVSLDSEETDDSGCWGVEGLGELGATGGRSGRG